MLCPALQHERKLARGQGREREGKAVRAFQIGDPAQMNEGRRSKEASVHFLVVWKEETKSKNSESRKPCTGNHLDREAARPKKHWKQGQ